MHEGAPIKTNIVGHVIYGVMYPNMGSCTQTNFRLVNNAIRILYICELDAKQDGIFVEISMILMESQNSKYHCKDDFLKLTETNEKTQFICRIVNISVEKYKSYTHIITSIWHDHMPIYMINI